ncbi:MAG TPA: DUF1697 domain-containing protein [Acidimicrobiales bacterium]|jgi:uncharacterized protein (DUF1697 family)|nr:DUF1697 domain-containing protein [Acidimicrobiales bacterium]
MSRHIALLRGINVGGQKKVPMAALRALFESLGYSDVVTLIQSGNAVFSAAGAVSSVDLEAAIATEFGFDVTVVMRTPRQLREIVDRNPFAREKPAALHVGFMAHEPAAAAVKQLDTDRFRPDEFAIKGTEIYAHLPNGLGRSKLLPYLDRQLKTPTTVRNWNTVNKLLELC